MTTAIRVRGLEKSYRRVHALRGLDFEVPTGQVTGFLGPNGAGKTTTFRALLGLTRPDGGEIEVLGHAVPEELPAVTKKVGAIVEEPGLIKSLSGWANLEIASDTLGFGHGRIDELLDFVGMAPDARRRVGEYSKGMRQRLALAAALLGDPRLLILDEPLDGLDPAGQHVFRARLRALADEGRTVVVSSHDLSDVEQLADWVVVIDQGRLVVEGPLEDLLGGGVTKIVADDPDRAASVLADSGFECRREGSVVLVDSPDAAALIQVLAESGVYPSEVRPDRSSLETVFLGITGGDRP